MFSIAIGLILYKVISTFLITCLMYYVGDKAFNIKVNFLVTWGIMFILALVM